MPNQLEELLANYIPQPLGEKRCFFQSSYHWFGQTINGRFYIKFAVNQSLSLRSLISW